MEEMMKAITRAANAVAAYYEKQAGVPATFANETTAPAEQPTPAPARTRKPRAEKTEAAASAPANPVPTPAAPVAMTEAESEAKLKTVGEAFVQRFSKQGDAVDEVKKTIEGRFKVARLRDLVHAQRVELIAILEGRIREIDSKQTQSAAPAVGLGL